MPPRPPASPCTSPAPVTSPTDVPAASRPAVLCRARDRRVGGGVEKEGRGPAPPCADRLATVTHDLHPRQAEHKEPYRTVCVVLVALGLAAVPAIALLGHRRLAVLWAAAGILALAIARIQRPDGTWLAARSRLFDVVFGIGLAAVLFILSTYANLPHVM